MPKLAPKIQIFSTFFAFLPSKGPNLRGQGRKSRFHNFVLLAAAKIALNYHMYYTKWTFLGIWGLQLLLHIGHVGWKWTFLETLSVAWSHVWAIKFGPIWANPGQLWAKPGQKIQEFKVFSNFFRLFSAFFHSTKKQRWSGKNLGANWHIFGEKKISHIGTENWEISKNCKKYTSYRSNGCSIVFRTQSTWVTFSIRSKTGLKNEISRRAHPLDHGDP